jgi:hypothetical protein
VLIRTWISFIIVGLLIAAMVAVGTAWPEWLFPAEIALLALLLALLNKLFPGRGGINIASVIVSLTAFFVILFYGAILLSRLNPLLVIAVGSILTTATIALSLMRRGKTIQERRALAGLCAACGYDLRESAARCPECGADIPEELARRRRFAERRRQLTPPPPIPPPLPLPPDPPTGNNANAG